MSERRAENRPDSSDRRDLPRPPLWFNLLLLLAGIAALFYARRERRSIDADFTRVFSRSAAGPSELNRMTAELAELDLAKAALEKELESRLGRIELLESRDFYLSIDAAKKTLTLKSGNDDVRTANLQGGAAKGVYAVARKKAGPPAVVFLTNGRAVSFMASEADLEAILKRITPETRVYVF